MDTQEILELKDKNLQDFLLVILDLKERYPQNVTQRIFGYHGILTHTKNVIRRAIEIYDSFPDMKPDIRMAIIIAAGFHDSGRVKGYRDNAHPYRGVENFKIFLKASINDRDERKKIGKEYQKEIEHAIKYHSTYKTKPESIIDICVWDADRIRLARPDRYNELYFHSEKGKEMAKKNKESL